MTVYNNGFVPNYLNVEASSAIAGTDASQFAIIGATSLYLAPGTSGTFTVRFNPTSSGMKYATLNITHNAQNALSPIVVNLSGSALPCSDILSLGSGGASNTATYSRSGEGLWNTSAANPCGYYSPGCEQIYTFTAPLTGYYSIQVTSTNNSWLDYLWKSGSCDNTGWNCIDDVYYPGSYGSAYWTAGTTYYILLDDETTALTEHTFYVYYNPCLNVTPIAGTGAANSATFTGGGNGGWYTSGPSPCGYYCPGLENVYSFVAPATGYYSLEVTSTTEYYVDYMWSTSCNPTGWNCIDDVAYPGTYGPMYWTEGTTLQG